MAHSIYLVNPAPDFPSYFGIEALGRDGQRKAANVLALSLPTVAALIPEDFQVTLCDECTAPADLETDAVFVGLTGMESQWRRTMELAAEFRRRGKIVLIGGPQATLRPDVVRPHCDILVRGEIEEIAEQLFGDLERGNWQEEYVGTRPDLAHSPRPRLDLYPNDRTLFGALQTSRGCPFRCEFCDVIQYLGRNQRHKPIPQVLAELDQLRDAGYRYVFIVDDNLTANNKRARALLTAIRDWNLVQDTRLYFASQVSVEAASDPELLDLMATAGLVEVFVGIETPNTESLAEVKKLHNNRCDLAGQIERFVAAGITVMGGMIVGFDADGPDIFRRQYEFAMSLPVPTFTPNCLYAPESTPLYARMRREGRIELGSEDRPFTPGGTNIVPNQMTREDLAEGLSWLCNRLYAPRAFEARLKKLALSVGPLRIRALGKDGKQAATRPVDREFLGLLRKLPRLGRAEAAMAARMAAFVVRHPRTCGIVLRYLAMYVQIRHVYDFTGAWDGALGAQEMPACEMQLEMARAS